MIDLTERQERAFRGFIYSNYIQMSASELGDPEIQALFDMDYVDRYWGGGMMWHLTRLGRELQVELGWRKSADQLVIDGSTGKMEQVP